MGYFPGRIATHAIAILWTVVWIYPLSSRSPQTIGSSTKSGVEPVNIQSATQSYEAWMRKCTVVVEADLKAKHEQMQSGPWYFMRGTFYRWAELFPEICRELLRAPKLLACGDLHV